jgi:hypothetical protein
MQPALKTMRMMIIIIINQQRDASQCWKSPHGMMIIMMTQRQHPRHGNDERPHAAPATTAVPMMHAPYRNRYINLVPLDFG